MCNSNDFQTLGFIPFCYIGALHRPMDAYWYSSTWPIRCCRCDYVKRCSVECFYQLYMCILPLLARCTLIGLRYFHLKHQFCRFLCNDANKLWCSISFQRGREYIFKPNSFMNWALLVMNFCYLDSVANCAKTKKWMCTKFIDVIHCARLCLNLIYHSVL